MTTQALSRMNLGSVCVWEYGCVCVCVCEYVCVCVCVSMGVCVCGHTRQVCMHIYASRVLM